MYVVHLSRTNVQETCYVHKIFFNLNLLNRASLKSLIFFLFCNISLRFWNSLKGFNQCIFFLKALENWSFFAQKTTDSSQLWEIKFKWKLRIESQTLKEMATEVDCKQTKDKGRKRKQKEEAVCLLKTSNSPSTGSFSLFDASSTLCRGNPQTRFVHIDSLYTQTVRM